MKKLQLRDGKFFDDGKEITALCIVGPALIQYFHDNRNRDDIQKINDAISVEAFKQRANAFVLNETIGLGRQSGEPDRGRYSELYQAVLLLKI